MKKYDIERTQYGTWAVYSYCSENGREKEFETTNRTKAEGVKEYLNFTIRKTSN